MDLEQAAALRKEFPAGAIGKLPKPYKKDSPKSKCSECGGYHGMPAAHLDFVGHAITTSRLLEVDPEWSWEPMAYDMSGLPMFDSNRNLWIKLTVCGVTRLGVGDGMSLKECIGDAIRNAAMRFGVALDLWAKEDAHAMAEERGTEDTAARPPKAAAVARTMSRTMGREATKTPEPHAEAQDEWMPPPDSSAPEAAMSAPVADPNLRSDKQSGMLHALLTKQGMGDREAGLAAVSDILDREVTTTTTLTKRECSTVIESLMKSAS